MSLGVLDSFEERLDRHAPSQMEGPVWQTKELRLLQPDFEEILKAYFHEAFTFFAFVILHSHDSPFTLSSSFSDTFSTAHQWNVFAQKSTSACCLLTPPSYFLGDAVHSNAFQCLVQGIDSPVDNFHAGLHHSMLQMHISSYLLHTIQLTGISYFLCTTQNSKSFLQISIFLCVLYQVTHII